MHHVPYSNPMSLIKDIDASFLQAMKQKNEIELSVLRMLKSSLKNKAIELIKKELEDAEVVAVIKSEIKKRKDSVEAYTQGARQDLADREQAEMVVLEKFLPTQMSPDVLAAKVKEIVIGLPEAERSDFGKVMRAVMAELKGSADGAAVSAAGEAGLGKKN